MKALAVALASLGVLTMATASSALDVTVLPKPSFPGPASEVSPKDRQLVLVSSRYRSPAELLPPVGSDPPSWAPKSFRGQDLLLATRQLPNLLFFVYGDAGAGRYLVGADARTKTLRYAFDFVRFATPPGGGEFEEVTWAREAAGVLYVEHRHLTYASTTRGRNGYLSAIDLQTRELLWRSPALVANAHTFVLDGDSIVSGYGFTAEADFLYVLDRRTGRVLDRLELPTAPEIIKRRGNRFHVRTYDHVVVVVLVKS